jgi:hypothetical protein
MAINRREATKDEWRELLDLIAYLSEDPLAVRRDARMKLILTAGARALVLRGKPACWQPDEELDILDEEGLLRPMPGFRQMIELMGGELGLLERIREGDLFTAEEMGPWTPGFVKGLDLSRALTRRSRQKAVKKSRLDGAGARYLLQMENREALFKDLESLSQNGPGKVNCSILRRGFAGGKILRTAFLTSLWVSEFPLNDPPSDPVGADVLAGIFAGALLIETESDRKWPNKWLVVNEVKADGLPVREMLVDWGVPWKPGKSTVSKEETIVSAFWGALFAPWMPDNSAKRCMGLHGVGDGTILPFMIWDLCVGGSLPKKALPYSVSKQYFYRQGYSLPALRRRALEEFGIAHVKPEMREVVKSWRQKMEERGLS